MGMPHASQRKRVVPFAFLLIGVSYSDVIGGKHKPQLLQIKLTGPGTHDTVAVVGGRFFQSKRPAKGECDVALESFWFVVAAGRLHVDDACAGFARAAGRGASGR